MDCPREEAPPYTTGYWQNKALEYAQRLATERGEIIRLRARIVELTQLAEYTKLEVHRLESEKQTEACCTGEMRESFQRELDSLYTRHMSIWQALGPEWNGYEIEDAVAQLKQDHINSVKIADRVPGMEREIATLADSVTTWRLKAGQETSIADGRIEIIQKLDREKADLSDRAGRAERYSKQLEGTVQQLNDDIRKLQETKDYALLTQLRDENRDLRARLEIATHGIEETVSRLKAHRES